MVGKDIIRMSLGELKRLKAVHEIRKGHITQKAAASTLGLSERQVRRLVRAVKEEGDHGVVHKNSGRRSKRKKPDKIRAKALFLYQKRYQGFGPTLAAEKLLKRDRLRLSNETLRQWRLIEAGLWAKRGKRSAHRRWREPELVIMGYADDATNKGVCQVLRLRRDCSRNGQLQGIYKKARPSHELIP
tara:strand:- start:415 stop:975 length:561 start_codon:yes stop_codon:yes gene_type:complete